MEPNFAIMKIIQVGYIYLYISIRRFAHLSLLWSQTRHAFAPSFCDDTRSLFCFTDRSTTTTSNTKFISVTIWFETSNSRTRFTHNQWNPSPVVRRISHKIDNPVNANFMTFYTSLFDLAGDHFYFVAVDNIMVRTVLNLNFKPMQKYKALSKF